MLAEVTVRLLVGAHESAKVAVARPVESVPTASAVPQSSDHRATVCAAPTVEVLTVAANV